jgi:glycerophosphoryl diester phosphodiesterase
VRQLFAKRAPSGVRTIPGITLVFLGLSCGTVPESAPTAWDLVSFPVVIAHRGGGNVQAPENTLAAFDDAAMAGVPLEADVLLTADGHLVVHHDDTTDRMCGTTGGVEVASLTLAELLALDCSSGYRPDLFSPQRVPTFGQFLNRYGSAHLLFPEVKTSAGPDAAFRAALRVSLSGLQRRVVLSSFSATDLNVMAKADPSLLRVLLCDCQIDQRVVTQGGLWGVGISERHATQSYVDLIHELGAKVFVWTVNSVVSAERLVAGGVDGVITDDPNYFVQMLNRRTPRGTTTVTPPASLVGSGWRARNPLIYGLPSVVEGFVTWQVTAPPGDSTFFRLHIPGLRTADDPAVQTITTTLKVAGSSGTPSRHLGLRFAWATDDDHDWYGNGARNSRQGYRFLHRLDGRAALMRDDGTSTGYVTLSTTTCTPLAVGDVLPLQVDMNATSVRVTRTDTGCSVAADDAIYPRGGFVTVYGSGVVPGVGTTTLSY